MKQHELSFLENILGNPLLEGFAAPRNFQEWGRLLTHDPRRHWQTMPNSRAEREVAVQYLRHVFVATKLTIELAMSLDRMLFNGLVARDPRVDENRRHIFGLKGAHESPDLTWQPSFASGMTVRGITNTGKSQVVDRFLSYLPQCIERQKFGDAWLYLKQLVYLKVHMPTDGTKGGLVANMAGALSKALNSDYTTPCQKQGTVDKQLAWLLQRLQIHRCGLLVIEEAQERNLANSKFSREFSTFFLSILNTGVPLVLMGNPLAFAEIDAFAQDSARFSDGGRFDLRPVASSSEAIWKDDFIPAIWEWSVLPEANKGFANEASILWEMTGGLVGLLRQLRILTLGEALKSQSAGTQKEHLERAFKHPNYSQMRDIAKAVLADPKSRGGKFKDIPQDLY